jgi:SAM-dependent methyltransferase
MSTAQDRYPEFVEDQRAFFDYLITHDWDTYASAAWNETRRREVQAVLSRVTARRILDVGCGCGFHDVEMAGWPGVDEVVGIDYSSRSIEVAQREFEHPKVHRRVADLFTMNDASFDLVVSFQVIEHLTSATEFLEACIRCVRPQGVVAVVTPNRGRFDNRILRLLGREPRLLDPQHYHEYTPTELQEVTSSLPIEPLATVGLSASLELPRLGTQLIPASLGRALARRWPAVSSSFAQLWRVIAPPAEALRAS